MAGINKVWMDYQGATTQTQKLEEIAAALQKIGKNELPDKMEKIRKDWEGENAQEYLRKMQALITKIEKTSSDLSKIASKIQTATKRTYETEMKNLEVAKVRKQ